jgi:hypothetical protein
MAAQIKRDGLPFGSCNRISSSGQRGLPVATTNAMMLLACAG